MTRILIAEDEERIVSFLEKGLRSSGYVTTAVFSGHDALAYARDDDFDLLILDLGLPGLDGQEVLRQLRARGDHTPVLVLSARAADADRIRGLELQADDYLTKPFHLRELLLRIEALLRRRPAPPAGADVLAFSGNRIDFRAMRAECRDGQTVDLTQSEARLLRLLAGHAGAVVLRKNVVEHVFGRDAAPTVRTLDNVVLRLRKLLEPDPAQPRHLLTVRGLGFRFEP